MKIHAECGSCHEREVNFQTTSRGGIVECDWCGAPHKVWIGEASGRLDVDVELLKEDDDDE